MHSFQKALGIANMFKDVVEHHDIKTFGWGKVRDFSPYDPNGFAKMLRRAVCRCFRILNARNVISSFAGG
jgi:hypothetical protein